MSDKKEALARFHRSRILKAAGTLFAQKGLEGAGMDEIAALAGYSKATVYAYFSGKEDLYYSLILEYMQMLSEGVCRCLGESEDFETRFRALCRLLIDSRYPMFSQGVMGQVAVGEAEFERLPVLRRIFEAGEEINRTMAALIQDGIESGSVSGDLKPAPAGLALWAAVTGLITFSANKRQYLEQALNMPREEFLSYGFKLLLAATGAGGEF